MSSVKVMGLKMAHVIVINSIATATVVQISFFFFFLLPFRKRFWRKAPPNILLGRCDGKYIMAMTQNYFIIEISQKAKAVRLSCIDQNTGKKSSDLTLVAGCSGRRSAGEDG